MPLTRNRIRKGLASLKGIKLSEYLKVVETFQILKDATLTRQQQFVHNHLQISLDYGLIQLNKLEFLRLQFPVASRVMLYAIELMMGNHKPPKSSSLRNSLSDLHCGLNSFSFFSPDRNINSARWLPLYSGLKNYFRGTRSEDSSGSSSECGMPYNFAVWVLGSFSYPVQQRPRGLVFDRSY
jgi:hypothetical protein